MASALKRCEINHISVEDLCDRRLPGELLPGNKATCSWALPQRHGRNLVLLSRHPDLYARSGHVEAQDHACSRHLSRQSVRYWRTDEGIHRGSSQSAWGKNIPFIIPNLNVLSLCIPKSLFSHFPGGLLRPSVRDLVLSQPASRRHLLPGGDCLWQRHLHFGVRGGGHRDI